MKVIYVVRFKLAQRVIDRLARHGRLHFVSLN